MSALQLSIRSRRLDERYSVHIPAELPAVLNVVFRGFPQFQHATTGIEMPV